MVVANAKDRYERSVKLLYSTYGTRVKCGLCSQQQQHTP